MDALTSQIATFASIFSEKHRTEAMMHAAKERFVDSIGCAIGAWRCQPARLGMQFATRHPAPGFEGYVLFHDAQRAILKLAVSSGDIGEYVISTPGLPAGREGVLQEAFARMVRDPRFHEEARQQRLGLDPLSGTEVRDLVRSVISAPSDVADEVRKVYPHQ